MATIVKRELTVTSNKPETVRSFEGLVKNKAFKPIEIKMVHALVKAFVVGLGPDVHNIYNKLEEFDGSGSSSSSEVISSIVSLLVRFFGRTFYMR